MAELRVTRRAASALIASAAANCASPRMSSGTQAGAAETMKRATRFMLERVAHEGGYVWSYLPDLSRRWGEMEAYPTMQWVQPPGTGTMGHVFLDAYSATRDPFYLSAAESAARALVRGQHASGGWNYMIDTAGEASLRRWYETIGKNGWRLEEFHHYWGNATFDDACTADCTHFLIRLLAHRRAGWIERAAACAIDFVLQSQLPGGGWPQRFPRAPGELAYPGYLTFNDDVAGENIKTLIMARALLGRADLDDAIRAGMNCYPRAQYRAPQAGWALQYDAAMQPAAARSYEPRALSTHTTQNALRQCLDFFVVTGDRRFLARIPEALAWLESARLPNGAYPTFVELGTNCPLCVHRRGSNVINGAYYADYDFTNPITHYGQSRALNLDPIRARLEALEGASVAEIEGLRREYIADQTPRFAIAPAANNDLNNPVNAPSGDDALIAGLSDEGYWPTPLVSTSHPYTRDGSPTPSPGDYSQTRVGDETDTSPFITDDPVMGISTGAYIQNMAALIRVVA